MLAFLFAIVYCDISKYQNRAKVIRLFDGKIVQSVCYNI